MACQDERDERTVITATSAADNDKSALISNKEDEFKNEGQEREEQKFKGGLLHNCFKVCILPSNRKMKVNLWIYLCFFIAFSSTTKSH